MSLVLRPYQQSATSQIECIWEGGVQRAILVLPTGTGKTECAKHLARNAKNPLGLAHRRSLVEQLQRRLGIPATTWQTLRRCQEKGLGFPNGAPDLVIVDEVHHGDSPDWQIVFDMIPETCPVLGLTATPWRFDHGTDKATRRKNARYGKGLGDLFRSMVIGITPRQAVASGYLVPLRVLDLVAAENECARRAGRSLPFNGGRIGAGDDVRLDIVDAWSKYGEGRKTMVFCHLVEAAEAAAVRFGSMGVPCSVVHGKLGSREVERRLEAFKRNEFKVLCNVMQLTEGIDVPDVGCVVIDRGANELNTYIQICGRAARPFPGKEDGLVLDLTGCSAEHGDPQKDQEYWIVTSEGRNVSDQCCDVCGTRVSPMFPGRCMRCDPFRPKLGAPQALLDTGARVYAALADVTKRFQTEIMAGTVDKDAMDRAAIDAIDELILTSSIIGGELEVAQEERTRALSAIEKREMERLEEERRKAELERLAELHRKVEAERQQREQEWQERLAARKAEDEKRRQERLEQQQAAARRNLAVPYEHGAQLTPEQEQQVTRLLQDAVQLFRARNWKLSGAAKRVRDQHPRWAGKFDANNYTIPVELSKLLGRLDTTLAGELSRYELQIMMTDQRTAQYGEAWCRKKVRELFREG